jgi:hypothetical protein
MCHYRTRVNLLLRKFHLAKALSWLASLLGKYGWICLYPAIQNTHAPQLPQTRHPATDPEPISH